MDASLFVADPADSCLLIAAILRERRLDFRDVPCDLRLRRALLPPERVEATDMRGEVFGV